MLFYFVSINILSKQIVIVSYCLSIDKIEGEKAATGGALYKKMFLKIPKLTGKHLYQSLLFNKVTGPRPATLLKRLLHRCFPVNFENLF